MKATDSFKQAIKTYLDQRASSDKLFSVSYVKPGKSIDQCCEYILGEAKKRGNAVAMTDGEVYGMAVHYYDEDNIKVNKVSGSCKVSTPATKIKLTKEENKAAREAAIKRLTEEQYISIKKRPKAKKEENVKQMSLFD